MIQSITYSGIFDAEGYSNIIHVSREDIELTFSIDSSDLNETQFSSFAYKLLEDFYDYNCGDAKIQEVFY